MTRNMKKKHKQSKKSGAKPSNADKQLQQEVLHGENYEQKKSKHKRRHKHEHSESENSSPPVSSPLTVSSPEPAALSEPSEPSEPTVPSDPSEPIVPSEPSERSEPSEPSEPSMPSEPSERSERSEPSERSESSEPSEPQQKSPLLNEPWLRGKRLEEAPVEKPPVEQPLLEESLVASRLEAPWEEAPRQGPSRLETLRREALRRAELRQEARWFSRAPPDKEQAAWREYEEQLPEGYVFTFSELGFGLSGSPAERLRPPPRRFSSFVIPQLETSEPIAVRKPKARTVEEMPASDNMDWMHGQRSEDASPEAKPDAPRLPTSQEMWSRYEALQRGENAEWPLCCLLGSRSTREPPSTPSPLPSPAFQFAPSPERECETLFTLAQKADIDTAIASIDNDKFPHRDEWERNLEVLQQDVNCMSIQFESMDLSLEEERALKEFIRSNRLHTPLSDIRNYEKLLNLARKEEKRKELRDTLRPQILKQMRSNRLMRPAAMAVNPPIVVNNEDLEKAIKSIIIVEPAAEQLQPVNINELIILKDTAENRPIGETTDQPVIVSVGGLKPEDEVVQEWLQQVGHDLSLVVQTRIESMPVSEQPTAEQPIDFEAKISECSQLQPKVKPAVPKADAGQWESSYKRRLEDFDEIVDQNMSEFRDPQSKRLRMKLPAEPVRRNLESLKRVLQMPALPSHLDQRLQQLRILRQPTKRKVERTSMPVEMKMVRVYSTVQANRRIDVSQLALELDNAIYNSDIQVLQQSYEAGHMAWIWQTGSILIVNARSKALLLDTQRTLLAKILGAAQTIQLPHCNAVHSQMVHIAQFTWQINIEEFSQSYSLSAEPMHDSARYAHYVHKTVPGVVAKVYESGVIHVYAMSSSLADTMLEKLYLLTANHRKPKTATVPPRPKPECNGTFISLFPT
ncbi:uncharacterized protein Dmoj_GI13529 [Drosophila mojavensis]|uniref:Uncharacterized protein n=1 Tax=Drosophila mojavensis TaxID=7230 RepID=B4KZE2_DROMO|nr:uncharacterized protein Dmoj_GI13529 [Drosophila mojavensis]